MNRLTFFTSPKAFRGIFDVIQHNAIQSWTLLDPRPEIILVGDDFGVAEAARRYGCVHVQGLARNEYGTPLISSIFSVAQETASNDLLCYLNSDIILLSDFIPAVSAAVEWVKDERFLLVGRKTTIDIPEPIDFANNDWEDTLRNSATSRGRQGTYDSDFFVFRKGMLLDVPHFAIGRCYWTQWFMYDTRRKALPMIDMTNVILSVESKHDYSHAGSTGGAKRLSGAEFRLNRRLFAGCRYYTTVDASDVMTKSGPVKRPLGHVFLSWVVRADYHLYFSLKGGLYPYSLPLILVGRWMRSGIRILMGRRRFVLR
jgi:hypothetical protein